MAHMKDDHEAKQTGGRPREQAAPRAEKRPYQHRSPSWFGGEKKAAPRAGSAGAGGRSGGYAREDAPFGRRAGAPGRGERTQGRRGQEPGYSEGAFERRAGTYRPRGATDFGARRATQDGEGARPARRPRYAAVRPFGGEGRRAERGPGEGRGRDEAGRHFAARRARLRDRDVHRVRDGEQPFRGPLAVPPPPEAELREDRLEGRNPVQEALKAGRVIDKLWIQRSAEGRVEPELLKLAHAVRDAGGVVHEVEKAALDKLSQTHAHQGVIAQTAMHEYYALEELLALAQSRGERPFIVLLDGIQDAYNLGAILRIADAAGAHGVVIPKRRSVGLDAVVAKASAGAIEHVRCCRVNNLVQCIAQLKEAGLWIVGTAPGGTAYSANEAFREAVAVVIGSEGEGMRPLVAKHCDILLSIPMRGRINSLNAAVAAGIVLFEAARQREPLAQGEV